jgi:hypothetical protein
MAQTVPDAPCDSPFLCEFDATPLSRQTTYRAFANYRIFRGAFRTTCRSATPLLRSPDSATALQRVAAYVDNDERAIFVNHMTQHSVVSINRCK